MCYRNSSLRTACVRHTLGLDSLQIIKNLFHVSASSKPSCSPAQNLVSMPTQPSRRQFYYILQELAYLNIGYVNCEPASSLLTSTNVSELLSLFLVIVQLDAQILFNVFIYLFIVLYMFRACHAHHQVVKLYVYRYRHCL